MATHTRRRDVRFVTVRRGGTLDDRRHRMLASWAADCADRVQSLFACERPSDDRPRRAIEAARAWANGDVTMIAAREAAVAAHGAAREVSGAAREAARAAGHAVATAHMADHALEAAAYALRAVLAAAGAGGAEAVRCERAWQRAQLPDGIRYLALDDQAPVGSGITVPAPAATFERSAARFEKKR